MREGFDTPGASHFVIVDQDTTGAHEEHGTVVIEVRQSGYGHRVFSPQGTVLPASYAVEIDARRKSGDPDTAAWGVLCHATLDQDYELAISTDGYFSILRDQGKSTVRLDRKNDKAAKKAMQHALHRGANATNRVRGECLDGGKLRLFVNGTFITEAVDPSPLPPGVFFGFAADATKVTDTLKVAFDNVKFEDLT